jgi:transposase InsO family protein
LAQHFGISRKTAYKWLTRYTLDGEAGLANRSRRPKRPQNVTPRAMESVVVEKRDTYKVWGGRKLRRLLQDERAAGTLEGVDGLHIPAASTITRILHRHDLISEEASQACTPHKRFERAQCNELIQMDFKGDIRLGDQTKSHPLTMLDDHSRFNLCLQTCESQNHDTVVEHMRTVFRNYGLPRAMLMDNGSPWAHSYGVLTRIELWLMRLGIRVIHGRIAHPQTQGKEERFHRTLKAEVLNGRIFPDALTLQEAFDQWRHVYNFVRPHEALDLDTPGSRYQPSDRPYPEVLPAVEYASGEIVRKVRNTGYLTYDNTSWYLSETLRGENVALRPTQKDKVFAVCYGAFVVGVLDCNKKEEPPYQRIQRYRSAQEIGSSEHPLVYEGKIIG